MPDALKEGGWCLNSRPFRGIWSDQMYRALSTGTSLMYRLLLWRQGIAHISIGHAKGEATKRSEAVNRLVAVPLLETIRRQAIIIFRYYQAWSGASTYNMWGAGRRWCQSISLAPCFDENSQMSFIHHSHCKPVWMPMGLTPAHQKPRLSLQRLSRQKPAASALLRERGQGNGRNIHQPGPTRAPFHAAVPQQLQRLPAQPSTPVQPCLRPM